MKNKKGFTIAELLLSMGIIGVISAVMLPSLTKARPNQELIMFKKAYYNTTRIVAELINDDDLYPERDDDVDGSKSGFANVSIKDMLDGVSEAKYHGKTYSGDSKFCGLFAAKMGVENPSCGTSITQGGNFTTSDGMTWAVPNGPLNGDSNLVFVDVNGRSKGDNCNEDGIDDIDKCGDKQKPDTFAIIVGQYGQVAIHDNIAKKYIESNSVNKKYKEFK